VQAELNLNSTLTRRTRHWGCTAIKEHERHDQYHSSLPLMRALRSSNPVHQYLSVSSSARSKNGPGDGFGPHRSSGAVCAVHIETNHSSSQCPHLGIRSSIRSQQLGGSFRQTTRLEPATPISPPLGKPIHRPGDEQDGCFIDWVSNMARRILFYSAHGVRQGTTYAANGSYLT
jgi:hypothetical protein